MNQPPPKPATTAANTKKQVKTGSGNKVSAIDVILGVAVAVVAIVCVVSSFMLTNLGNEGF